MLSMRAELGPGEFIPYFVVPVAMCTLYFCAVNGKYVCFELGMLSIVTFDALEICVALGMES
jgi:hypothetical protein